MKIPNTISESSKLRIAWDSVILCLIFVSCTLIPLQIVFQGWSLVKILVILYVIDLFFFVDIWLNFRTSFHHQGNEILDHRKISMHYLKSFFPIDLLSNFPFELLMLPYLLITGRGISFIIFFHLLRLLRISRLFLIFQRWERTGWINPSLLRISKFLGFIAILIHWLACIWFQVAAGAGFPYNSWVVTNGLLDADVMSQYIRSIYWTITTMTTVGYGDIVPQRNIEYIVSIVVMLLGASMYAFIIGNIASLMSNLDSGKVNHWRKMENVTGYLRGRHVPKNLVARVRDYYEYLWGRYRGLPEQTLVANLPESLRLKLLLYLAKDLLKNVPLFKYCKPSLRDALMMELKQCTYDPGSHVVKEGDIGKEIFFISEGVVEIVKKGKKKIEVLHSGDYFGHMSILLKEKRTATVVAISYCEMFVLSEKGYKKVLQNYPELRDAIKKMSSEASEKLAALIRKGVVL